MGCCVSCCCMNCILDSYLHINIRDIRNTDFTKGDFNIAGTRDICVRAIYQSCSQDTKIFTTEIATISINEPIILEDCKPSDDDEMLRLEVYDVDNCTADDLLGIATIKLPTESGRNLGEQEHEIKSPKNNEIVGLISVDQIHFIQQKTVRYTGPCKTCCCCLELGTTEENY